MDKQQDVQVTECLFREFGSSAGSDRGCSGTFQARRAAVARAAQVDRVAVVRHRALVRTELRVMRKCGAYQKAFLQLRWALAVCENCGHTRVGLGELVHVLLFDDRNGLQRQRGKWVLSQLRTCRQERGARLTNLTRPSARLLRGLNVVLLFLQSHPVLSTLTVSRFDLLQFSLGVVEGIADHAIVHHVLFLLNIFLSLDVHL